MWAKRKQCHLEDEWTASLAAAEARLRCLAWHQTSVFLRQGAPHLTLLCGVMVAATTPFPLGSFPEEAEGWRLATGCHRKPPCDLAGLDFHPS